LAFCLALGRQPCLDFTHPHPLRWGSAPLVPTIDPRSTKGFDPRSTKYSAFEFGINNREDKGILCFISHSWILHLNFFINLNKNNLSDYQSVTQNITKHLKKNERELVYELKKNLFYIIKQQQNNKRMETLLGALIFGTVILVYGFLTVWAAYQNENKK
jgi:hypothetical protein